MSLVLVSAPLSVQCVSASAEVIPAAPLPADLSTGLQDAPAVQSSLTAVAANTAPNPGYATALAVRLDSAGKAHVYLHRVVNVGAILGPAAEAATVMLLPPKYYPDNWRQGAEAYGRNFGASSGRIQTAELTRFVAGIGLHEDPRYYPAANRNFGARIVHALGFSLVDRSDLGQLRLAYANLIGATAGGFVGNAWMPGNYSDVRHAGVRTGLQMGSFSANNIIEEFAPELRRLSNALTTRLHRNN